MTTQARDTVTVRREVLIRARVAHGLNKAQLARKAQIQLMDVYKAEHFGSASPKVIKALSVTLELDTNDFVEVTLS